MSNGTELRLASTAPVGGIVGSVWSDTSVSPPLLRVLQSTGPDVWAEPGGGALVQESHIPLLTLDSEVTF